MPASDVCRVVFVTAMWGLAIVGIKEVIAGTPTLLSGGARFLLSGALLVAVERRAGVTDARRPSWGVAAGIGVLQTAGLFGFVYVGLEHSPSSAAAVVVNTTPILAVLLAMPVLGERPRPIAVLGLVLALGGVALVSGGGSGGSAAGLGLVALGALSWAAATVALKLVSGVSPLSLAGRQMLVGGAVLTVAGLLLDDPRWAITPGIVAWFLFLVLPAGVASFTLWFGVLERHSVNRVSPFMLLAPVFGVAGGVLIRGEPAGAALFIGTALVLAGVATAQRSTDLV